jgi:integrase
MRSRSPSFILATLVMGIALPAHSFTNWARTLPLTAAPSYGGSMQTAVVKPRVIYAEFKATQQPQQVTVAAIINRYIEEMDGGIRPLGESNRITLRRIQRHWLGAKVAATLDKRDIIDYCRERRKDVCPATINGDLTSLTSALKYAGSAWDECENVSDDAITDAKPFLKKHDLLGKSTPRTRRPTADEKLALETRFAAQNLHPRTTTDMVRVSKWQHASSRRIGESCALLWRDWMPDEQTILVRKMKDPKNRAKQKVVALPHDAQALLYAWAYELDAKPLLRNEEPRILPFNSKTCSQRYTLAKKDLQRTHPTLFDDLRMHDNRAAAFVRLLRKGYTVEQIQKGVSLHRNDKVLKEHYLRIKAAELHAGPLGMPLPERLSATRSAEA